VLSAKRTALVILGWWVSGGVQTTPQAVAKYPICYNRGIDWIASRCVAEPLARLFLLENQMNQSIVNNYFKALEALLSAGATYAQALHELKAEYDKAKPAEQTEIRNRVAQVIGKKYGVKPKIMEKGINKGLLGFNAHGSKEESNARDFMRDNFAITKKVVGKKPTTKVSAKVDEAEELLKQLYSLSKKDQARFDVLYTNDKKAKARAK
jgi:hypothetical protein